jgi:hypothetical protein
VKFFKISKIFKFIISAGCRGGSKGGKQGPGPPLQDLPPAKLASCKTFKFFLLLLDKYEELYFFILKR